MVSWTCWLCGCATSKKENLTPCCCWQGCDNQSLWPKSRGHRDKCVCWSGGAVWQHIGSWQKYPDLQVEPWACENHRHSSRCLLTATKDAGATFLVTVHSFLQKITLWKGSVHKGDRGVFIRIEENPLGHTSVQFLSRGFWGCSLSFILNSWPHVSLFLSPSAVPEPPST